VEGHVFGEFDGYHPRFVHVWGMHMTRHSTVPECCYQDEHV